MRWLLAGLVSLALHETLFAVLRRAPAPFHFVDDAKSWRPVTLVTLPGDRPPSRDESVAPLAPHVRRPQGSARAVKRVQTQTTVPTPAVTAHVQLSATRTPSEAGAVSGDAGATKPRSFDAERGPETSRQAKNTNVDVDIAALRERLEQRVDSAYPVRARKAGVEGTVVVTFAVGGTGGARDLAVAMSSGSQLLDEAALRLVRESGPYPHIPVTLRLPIRFRLRR